ncbi:hypothetical protein A4X03_0g8787 [Tilletia caries]|uniref:ATP-dependent DNA helicase n=1 Tax=Tilletia caries TaxID=13290 RepID=A0A8T8SFX2_9BASI|nr:hypothetical protein A4X03_0g8787 [Tilletia caries]
MRYVAYYETVTSRAATASEIEHPEQLHPLEHLERTERASNFPPRVVHRRLHGKAAARIKTVRPSAGDAFFMRLILLHRPIANWMDFRRTADGQMHASIRDAAAHEGLIEGENEAHQVMVEATQNHSAPSDLRFLLALLIFEGAPSPITLWLHHKEALARDYLPLAFASPATAPSASRRLSEQAALDDIDRSLATFGLSNIDIGLPVASSRPDLIEEELNYFAPHRHRLRQDAAQSRALFTQQQHAIRAAILDDILAEGGSRLHLIQGRAGRGKTFLVKAIIDELRGNGHVVATCGATGLSASAFTRGTTVHKRFAIPVIEDNDDPATPPPRSQLSLTSDRATYLRQSSALLIDEIWALPRPVIEAVDAFLRALMESDAPFGGKCVIAVGDPRQTAPITKENTRQATIDASFLSTQLFPRFQLHELHASQRQAHDLQFGEWVDNIGDDSSSADVDLSLMFASVSTPQAALDFLFPPAVLNNPQEAVQRCFLTPLNVTVDDFNTLAVDSLPGQARTYTRIL